MGSSLDITHFQTRLFPVSRPLRLSFLGAIYHLTSCGNERAAIYLDDEDKQLFLNLLTSCIEKFHWLCHAYCPMDNHYHLLIKTPDANLQAAMRQLNSVCTRQFIACTAESYVFFEGATKRFWSTKKVIYFFRITKNSTSIRKSISAICQTILRFQRGNS
ncbi:transposase [Undibacterium sp. FT79W]|uniref:transposase n=1 Tax=Undibacterium sp. FT79W TaxID=2762296 RepID=UPI00164A4025|nr:transposase [Undibacterium sp. FT79W]MBC3878517.1 transposase [Undibacterium sp. FT79W]